MATPADADGLGRVHALTWRAAYRGIVPAAHLAGLTPELRSQWWREELAQPPKPGRVVRVAVTQDDGVVGFSASGPARDDDLPPPQPFELYAIYVAPEWWGLGVGARLLDAVVSASVGQAPGLVLWVLADNTRGRRFYERCGFHPDGTVTTIDIGGARLEELRYRRSFAPQ